MIREPMTETLDLPELNEIRTRINQKEISDNRTMIYILVFIITVQAILLGVMMSKVHNLDVCANNLYEHLTEVKNYDK